MKRVYRLLIPLFTFAAASSAAQSGEFPIDISALANLAWTAPFCGGALNNAATLPTGGQVFGGVPFVIPDGTNNYWSGALAANCGAGATTLTVPVGVFGVTSAFTVMNTIFGQPGPNAYLYVTFTGSGGATRTVRLVGGVNVRDYNQDGFQNTINNTSTVQVFNNGIGQRLDRQEYLLPKEFASQILTSITITDSGAPDFSRAVFAALTVSNCPAFVAERVSTTAGSIVYLPGPGLYEQDITLTNTGTTAVTGPLFFILEGLPATVTLANNAGATTCFAPLGSPYVLPLRAGASLAPNTSVVFHLFFSTSAGSDITYQPLTTGSLGGKP